LVNEALPLATCLVLIRLIFDIFKQIQMQVWNKFKQIIFGWNYQIWISRICLLAETILNLITDAYTQGPIQFIKSSLIIKIVEYSLYSLMIFLKKSKYEY